jgi:hypothetical protein
MIAKLSLYFQILRNMGWQYVQFRVFYAIRGKLGVLKRQFPQNPDFQQFISLEDWKKQTPKFFFDSKESLSFPKKRNEILKKRYKDFLDGKLWYFNVTQYNIGRDYDWLTNPDTGFRYDVSKHWSEVADISAEAGDIKYVWEKSRFSYLYDLIRYDYHFEKDCSELIFSEIDNWIDANPINQGPNWKCSQEISLRTLNWLFALHYYKNSAALTEARFQKIMHVIYWQIKHDYANIDFSRKTVRNNHAVTECLMLYLGGLLLPFFPESKTWKTKGKRWFEEEILYQVYEDGTFLQFSHNYHRVLIQLMTWAFYLAEANREEFEPKVYERAKRSFDYLTACQAGKNGELPNYGANDGALFFKLNDAEYRDYRPQLSSPTPTLPRREGQPNAQPNEDFYWYSSNIKNKDFLAEKFDTVTNVGRVMNPANISYENGGIFLIDDENSFTFIKCADYKDRPSQADNLHIDIWYKGENILRDAGSYKYNTDNQLVRYFSGTKGHNTVMLGDNDQMLKGPRFIWLNWSKVKNVSLQEDENYYIFAGEITAFEHLEKGITHKRIVKKHKNKPIWEIEDTVNHNTDLPMIQRFHFDEKYLQMLDFQSDATINAIEDALYSGHYGVKESSKCIAFISKNKTIRTVIKLK